MIKSDKELLWRPGRMYYPQSAFSGWMGTTATDVGRGAGAPIQQEISTFGIAAALFDTAADELAHDFQLPYDLDVNFPVQFRVHFTTGSATAADTITWKVYYLACTPGVTALIDPTAVLTVPITQQTVTGTAYVKEVSPWGTLIPGLITAKTEYLVVKVAMTEFAVGLTEDKFLLGLEMRYTPKRLQGVDGMSVAAKSGAYMFAKNVNA